MELLCFLGFAVIILALDVLYAVPSLLNMNYSDLLGLVERC